MSRLTGVLAVSAAAIFTLGAARSPGGERREMHRVQAHLDSVLVELDSSAPSGLSESRAARRTTLIRELRRYRDAGVFPHNYDFPGQAVPYFVDRKTGTLCAVADLLAFSRRRDIVDRVAHADNNVRVAALAGDTALGGWLAFNGLTLEDAERIQVVYVQSASNADVARNVAFIALAPPVLGGAALTAIWNATSNADGHRTFARRFGLVTGLAAVTAGALARSTTGISADGRNAATAAIAVGALSTGVSIRAMRRHTAIVAAANAARQRTVTDVRVGPLVTPNHGGGVAVSLRF